MNIQKNCRDIYCAKYYGGGDGRWGKNFNEDLGGKCVLVPILCSKLLHKMGNYILDM